MHVLVKAEVKKTSKSHISYRMTSMTALALPSVGDFLYNEALYSAATRDDLFITILKRATMKCKALGSL